MGDETWVNMIQKPALNSYPELVGESYQREVRSYLQEHRDQFPTVVDFGEQFIRNMWDSPYRKEMNLLNKQFPMVIFTLQVQASGELSEEFWTEHWWNGEFSHEVVLVIWPELDQAKLKAFES